MPVSRKEIASVLEEIARLLELKGENPFKCRAFESAARAIERAEGDIEGLVSSGALTSIRGVGKSTAEQVVALVREGRAPLLDELRASFPEGLLKMLDVPGLGPKRLRVIYEALGVSSISELEYAIHENRLRDLPGFGEKSQENLRLVIETIRRSEGWFLLPAAWEAAATVLAINGSGDRRIEIAGELRRQLETLSEILVVAESEEGSPPSETVGRTDLGIPYRILMRPAASFEACWLWESCGPEHRASLQQRALSHGLSFGPDGLRRDGEIVPLDEAGVYHALGLEPVHPLLREGPTGETPHPDVMAGPESIHGIFHVHTTDSDGAATLEEMVREAERMGYLWIGISDHSQAAFYANGLTPERLRAQRVAIDEVQKRHPRIRILHGIESDILGDGSLDYEDDLLRRLDFVVASVHSQMRMDRGMMTARIERALRHPATTHWGHPTGRLLLGREGYDCDIEHLLRVCAEEGVSVEFNANPQRLDLDWRWIPRAIALGVPISVDPDAHSLGGLADARLTVGTAAKGGLAPTHLLNNAGAEEIDAWLRGRRGRWKETGA
jgi:DNA polymerase (family X)